MERKNDIIQAAKIVAQYCHRTPVLTSTILNDMAGCQLFFKCENFQKMGAFKMRGAVHALSHLSATEKMKGVITHSSGNFAQALSLSAKLMEISATIVMPSNAPKVKMEAVKYYGGRIIISGPSPQEREQKLAEVQANGGQTFIHPSNQLNVILGNATSCYELLEDHPDLNAVVSPIGGGGLGAGTTLSAHYFGENCSTYGAEPAGADDAYHSLRDNKIYLSKSPDTIADGLRTNLGDINFPILKKYLSEILLVTDDEIRAAMKLIFQYLKIVIEPSSATVLAAILKNKSRFSGQKVGLIISGGNVDLGNLGNLFS